MNGTMPSRRLWRSTIDDREVRRVVPILDGADEDNRGSISFMSGGG